MFADEWDLGDGMESSSASASRTYDKPGSYGVSLKVDCDDCNSRTEHLTVTVRCPKVEITDAEPDIPYVCPGCQVQHTATIDPPDRTIYWDLILDLGGKATIDNTGLLSIAADAAAGVVGVRASALPGASDCSDHRTLVVFVPFPDAPPDGGTTEAEKAWAHFNKLCALDNFLVQGRCERDTAGRFGIRIDEIVDGTIYNAWLHAYCNCIVASRCGSSVAKKLWDAHEDYLGNPCKQASLDLYNNEIGRDVSTGNVGMCHQLIDQAMDEGRLRWIGPPPTPPCPSLMNTP